MPQALAGSTLIINNETVPYEPNSLVYDFGNPEVTVRPQVVGNGAVQNTSHPDFSTAKSKVTFELNSTSENEDALLTWIDNFDENVIKIVSPDGKARVFEGATVMNKPEITASNDGNISVEFESSQAVKG